MAWKSGKTKALPMKHCERYLNPILYPVCSAGCCMVAMRAA
jgi:hypothetical protein